MNNLPLLRRAAVLTAGAAVLGAAVLGACAFAPEFNPNADVPVDLAGSGNRLAFGVSSGDSTWNSITMNADGSIRLRALNDTFNAGKIAGSEDGITFYFREVAADRNFKLSATVRVISFGGADPYTGEPTSNGQEGFGLMARDYVPQYPGFTLADVAAAVASGGEYHANPVDPATGREFSSTPGGASNMVMVGGVKRGVRAAIRYGVVGSADCVTDPNVLANAGRSLFDYSPRELSDYSAYATLDARPDFPAAGTVYRLSLVKTNSAFIASIVPPPGRGVPQEVTFRQPDILKAIKGDAYYVGLFAARAAVVEFSDVTYFESDSAMDAPAEAPAPIIVAPRLSVVSPATDTDADYRLRCTANVRGSISVMQDGKPVPGAEMLAGTWYSSLSMPAEAAVMQDICVFDIPTLPLEAGENSFQIVFYPEESASISSNAAIRQVFGVERRAYFDPATPIRVAPDGRAVNAGTAASPLDLATAIAFVQAGQKIIMADGTYRIRSVRIPRYNSGKRGLYKQLVAETRGGVYIDFGKDPEATGFVLLGDFWRIDGLRVFNTPDKVKGFVVSGNNNIVEYVRTYSNGDTGLQISGSAGESRTWWPMFNTVRYCDSYDNLDAAMNDADGFAAKLTVGEGNKFQWCASYNNCDDGWDLFTKKESGLIGAVTLENCLAFRNGTLMDGFQTNSGRNGFKMGGEGLGVQHVVRNSVAFQNGAHGFTSNSNGDVQIENCTSFDNGVAAWNGLPTADSRNFTVYNGSGKIDALTMKQKLTNVLSLFTDGAGRQEDKVQLAAASGYAWLGSMNGATVGTATRNLAGTVLDDASVALASLVVSLTPPLDAAGFPVRDAQGRWVMNGFLALNTPAAFGSPGAVFNY
jgi:hypothetical protein